MTETCQVSSSDPLRALNPASDGDDEGVVSLEAFKGTLPHNGQDAAGTGELEDSTPEDICRRSFPHLSSPNASSLDWISPSPLNPSTTCTNTDNLPFDFTGVSISPSLAQTLSTRIGLHHHAEGRHAGYTLDDVFLLSRSTVPAQRASMLDVLSRVARQISRVAREQGTHIRELAGQEADLR